jgi:hypothetical protein
MRRRFLTFAALALALVAPAAAHGKALVESPRVQFGVVAQVEGAGCSQATFSRRTRAREPLTLTPAVGQHVGDYDDIVVTDARVVAGSAVWTVQPTSDECQFYADDATWSWATEERSWGLVYRERSYVIRATAHHGVRSIAGFRVRGRTLKSLPTIRKARRRLGRPSSIRRNDVSCRARWDSLGLTIYFVNYGIGNPCRHGFAQSGRVRAEGKSAPWTAVVGNRPGVATGTTEDFLDYELIGEPSESSGAWSLADAWIPYGDAGFYPILTALVSSGGRVRGFEFWIGAGGD